MRTGITEPSIIGWRNANKRTNLANWTRETERPLATLGMWWGKNLARALVFSSTCSRVPRVLSTLLYRQLCAHHTCLSPLRSDPTHRVGSGYQTLVTTVVAVSLYLSLKRMLSFRACPFPSLHTSQRLSLRRLVLIGSFRSPHCRRHRGLPNPISKHLKHTCVGLLAKYFHKVEYKDHRQMRLEECHYIRLFTGLSLPSKDSCGVHTAVPSHNHAVSPDGAARRVRSTVGRLMFTHVTASTYREYGTAAGQPFVTRDMFVSVDLSRTSTCPR